MSEPRKFITYPLVIDWLQWSDEFTEDNRPAMALKLIHEFRTHIKDLEAQLAEANEVVEFYGDEKNWMTTRKDELHEARMTIIQDPESFGQYDESWNVSTLLLIGGKRARQYLEKWKVGSEEAKKS